MTKAKSKTSRPVAAFLIGIAATVLMAMLVGARLDERLEWITYDWRVRHFTPELRSDDILHVDIDDHALEALGRFPWPRETLAGVVQTLHECGATSIALDILLPDPQPIRVEAELTGTPRSVCDDLILAEAFRRAGNVTLVVPIDFDAPAEDVEMMGKFSVPIELHAGGFAEGALTPPLDLFATTIADVGHATHTPDADGVTRRVQLVGTSGPMVILGQLGATLAMDALSESRGLMGYGEAFANRAMWTFDDGSLVSIPLDGEGRMLINYVRGLDYSDHLSAGAMANVIRARQAIGACRRAQWLILADLASPDLLNNQVFVEYMSVYQQAQLDQTILADDALGLGGHERRLAAEAEAFIEEIDTLHLATELTPEHPSYAIYEVLVAARKDLATLEDNIATFEKQVEAELTALRPWIDGKICLVGSTTTGAADFTATPIDKLTPGVVVHANILEMVRSGRFIHPISGTMSMLIVLALGVVTSWLASRGSLVRSVVLAGAVIVLYVAFAGVAFHQWGWWVVIAGPVGCVVFVLLAVSVFRQLTEQRAKNRIRNLFAHAVSNALVDELLSDPSMAELGGQVRDVTCLFCDLAGFTCLAESLGPQRTVAMLNRYFDHMTQIVQDRFGGYVNKFLGDGLFCLFGAPVVQDDHASRAIGAAIECQKATGELNAGVAETFGFDAHLGLRIGVVSGKAMVGNCGSSTRMDYTAIGDCVNLASRLESANKFLGTRILVPHATWVASGQAGASRYVGRVGIRGLDRVVALREVFLGEAAPRDVAAFEAAIELYETRHFARAAEAFEAIINACPEDVVAGRYAELAKLVAGMDADADWSLPESLTDGTVQFRDPR
jgi:class 3 adenylate cyclase/CHASE2 domain-containing sensor protein